MILVNYFYPKLLILVKIYIESYEGKQIYINIYITKIFILHNNDIFLLILI